LGEKITFSFSEEKNWGKDEKYSCQLVVVGLLRNKTNQVYFHRDLCRMLTIVSAEQAFILQYGYDSKNEKYVGKKQILPVISEDLMGNTIRVSRDFELPYDIRKQWSSFEEVFQEKGSVLFSNEEMDVRFDTTYSNNGDVFLEVSEEFFDKMYEGDTTEISVYISNYKNTDKVIKKLEKIGYDAVSTYRASRGDYDSEKVYQRLEIMGISGIVLVMAFFLCYFLVSLFLKMDTRKYQILYFVGLSKKKIGHVLYGEMIIFAGTAFLIGTISCNILAFFGISKFADIQASYTFLSWCIYFCYQLLLAVVPVTFFVRKKVL
jgi:ABC-type antimicrobial peptide transport system permease subunit